MPGKSFLMISLDFVFYRFLTLCQVLLSFEVHKIHYAQAKSFWGSCIEPPCIGDSKSSQSVPSRLKLGTLYLPKPHLGRVSLTYF